MPWMMELEESKKAAAAAAAAQPESPGKTPSTGTPADTQPNTPAPGRQLYCYFSSSKEVPKVYMHASFKLFLCSNDLLTLLILPPSPTVSVEDASKTEDANKDADKEKEQKKEGEVEKNGKETKTEESEVNLKIKNKKKSQKNFMEFVHNFSCSGF